jgi:hypothetical protein
MQEFDEQEEGVDYVAG